MIKFFFLTSCGVVCRCKNIFNEHFAFLDEFSDYVPVCVYVPIRQSVTRKAHCVDRFKKSQNLIIYKKLNKIGT